MDWPFWHLNKVTLPEKKLALLVVREVTVKAYPTSRGFSPTSRGLRFPDCHLDSPVFSWLLAWRTVATSAAGGECQVGNWSNSRT